MTNVITITGFKNSGKTSILEDLLRELTKRGFDVGTVKHIPHSNFTLGQEGTDTQRHITAGSNKTVAVGPKERVTWEKKETEIEDLLQSMQDMDFVIMEGFKETENIAKIAVAKNKADAEKLNDEFTIGFIGHGTETKPILKRENHSKLADMVEEKATPVVGGLDCGDCGYETCREFVLANIEEEDDKTECVALKGRVTLRVDGKQIPLKSFIKNMVGNTIEGLIESLKKTEGKEIEIEIRKDKG